MAEKKNFFQYKKEIFDVLIETGLEEKQSDILADYMTTVDFYGIKSHGVRTLNAHIRKIKNGEYNTNPDFQVTKDFPSFSVIDGDNAIGMVSAEHCIDYAKKRAKEAGMYSVYSNNNNTYGAAFYYALQAAKDGFICFTMSNSPAQMAPVGGRDKMLGTNPFAVAIPGEKEYPLIIDMATSVVAKSKINEYKEKNQPLPCGWALNSQGVPTTDAQEALEGLMLPMAGFKGYGISLIIDSLAGFLSGANFLDGVGRFYNSEKKAMGVGFNFIIISPEIVYGEEFYSDFDEYLKKIRKSSVIENQQIVLPGDDRIKIYKENIQNGLELNWENI